MEKQIPKNVRQIGNVSDSPKIYIEDYVDTYLNQLCDKAEETPMGAFLVGQAVTSDEQECVFISGAILMDEVEVVGPDVAIGEKVFAAAKEKRKEFFEEDGEIIGWFLIMPGSPLSINSNFRKLHDKFFTKQNCVFIMKDPVEKDEVYYAYKLQELMQIAGHYIYYEKNPAMQNYMLTERKKIGVTPSEMVADKAAKDFRSIVRDKMEVTGRNQSTRWTYAASTFLVLVVMVIGVTMINNYDRMKSVQSSLDLLTESVSKDNGGAVNVSANAENIEAQDGGTQVENTPEKMPDDAEPVDNSDAAADQSAAQETNAVADKIAYETYTVEAGDTLAKISVKIYGNKNHVDEISKLNEITDSNMIYVGQKLLLP